MSPLTEPTRIVLAKGYTLPDDPDAVAYITAVEAADTAAGSSGGLETATRMAINGFVKGCKADGIWPAIKASCILAGARTLAGALVPLLPTMPAPTNFNFVSGDYNRKTGLVGDGSTKYLDSGLDSGTTNSDHASAYVTESVTSTRRILGTRSSTTGRIELSWSSSSTLLVACQNLLGDFSRTHTRANGLAGVSSNFSTGAITTRGGGTTITAGSFGRAVVTSRIDVFTYAATYYPGRLAFYSIGESLDLAKLDTRVTALIAAINVAF